MAYSLLSAPSWIKKTATYIIDMSSLTGLSMPRLRHLARLSSWHAKLTHTILTIIGQRRVTSARTKILKLRRPTALHPLTRIIVEMKSNQDKFWVRLKRIFVSNAKTSKARLSILPPLAVMVRLSKKIRSRVIRT